MDALLILALIPVALLIFVFAKAGFQVAQSTYSAVTRNVGTKKAAVSNSDAARRRAARRVAARSLA